MNFDDKSTWETYDQADQANLRIEIIKSMIPSDVNSILDVGCGNGIITNRLAESYLVTGIDTSAAALEYLKCSKQMASITEIPYLDNSFEMVMCNEVLEHLDVLQLSTGIHELTRVAQKYLLISTPNREQLSKLNTKCADCGKIAHIYDHLQSLDASRLTKLVSNKFMLSSCISYGPKERDYPEALLNFKQRALKQWFKPYEDWHCDACGSGKYVAESSLPSKVINAFNKVISPLRPFWLSCLFKRVSG